MKECGVTIDEAALHDVAFQVENTLRQMDKNLISDDIIPTTDRSVKVIKDGRHVDLNSGNDRLSISPDKKIKFEDRDRSRVNNYDVKDTAD